MDMQPTDYSLAPQQGQQPGQQPLRLPGFAGMSGGGNQQISPELVQQMLSLSGMTQQQADIARQRKLAEVLRSGAGDQLKGQMVGRHFVGPGAANVLANAAMNYRAYSKDRGADTDQKALDEKRRTAAGDWFKRLTENSGGQGGALSTGLYSLFNRGGGGT